MKCWAMMYYGCGYSPPNQFDRRDVEEFASIQAALDQFDTNVNWDHFRFPCVDQQETAIHIFFYDPFEDGDCQPDRIYKFGPRGALRRDY